MNTQNCSPLPQQAKPTTPPMARAIVLAAAAIALAVLFGASQPAQARATSSYSLLKTYPNPAPDVGEEFGNAVAWLPPGDKLIVGARSDRLGGANQIGAAYVLSATAGTILHTFTETASAPGDYFGYSIALSGTRALIGAPHNGAIMDAGSAYLYDTTTGAVLQTFHNPIPSMNDNFGASVAILSATAVLVGEPQYLITDTGRVYICLIADGTCPTPIDSPSVTPSGGFFGLSVAALANRFAVAAPLDGSHGTAYVFTTTAVSSHNTIVLTTTTPTGDYFGSALAAVNGNLLVGAQNGGTSALNTPGAAYLYTPQGTLLRSFYYPDVADTSTARFGAAVAGDGNRLLIGAPDAFGGEGRAYVFDATTGALLSTFKKTSPVAGDHFGNAVAILGEDFLVGAPGDSTGASGAGAVYRFGVVVQFNLYLPLTRR